MHTCQVVTIGNCLLGKVQDVVSVAKATRRGDVHFLREVGDCGGALRPRRPCWPCQLADQDAIVVHILIIEKMLGLDYPLFVGVGHGKSVGVSRLVELE